MPKIIQTVYEVIPEQSVLVRSAYLQNDIKAAALISGAQRTAKRLLAQAQQDAEALIEESRSQAYAAAIVQAAGELAAYLSAQQDLSQRLHDAVHESARAVLAASVGNPEVAIAGFDEFLGRQAVAPAAAVELVLPEAFRLHQNRLRARLQQHCSGNISFSFHAATRFLIRVGDQVAEFAPDDFVTLAAGTAMSELPSIYAENAVLAQYCREQLCQLLSDAGSQAGAKEAM